MLGPPGLQQILQIAFPVTDYAERCYVQVMFEMGAGGEYGCARAAPLHNGPQDATELAFVICLANL